MDKYIIIFYNKKTNKTIGYLHNDFTVVEDIYASKKFDMKTKLYILAKMLIYDIYNKKGKGVINTEMERIKMSMFDGIDIKDVGFKIRDFLFELRDIKLKKLMKKINS